MILKNALFASYVEYYECKQTISFKLYGKIAQNIACQHSLFGK